MLKVSRLADYAVIMMCALAECREYASASEIATLTKVSKTTASKILKMLAKAGLIQAVRGSKGGYALIKKASEISLAAVVAAMDGPIALTECSTTKQNCSKLACCEARPHWQFINQVIDDVLSHYTLDDTMKPMTKPDIKFNTSRLSTMNIKIVENYDHRK